MSADLLMLTDAPGADATAAIEGSVLVSDAGTQAVVGGILGRTSLASASSTWSSFPTHSADAASAAR